LPYKARFARRNQIVAAVGMIATTANQDALARGAARCQSRVAAMAARFDNPESVDYGRRGAGSLLRLFVLDRS
jgi:hypothetical protein